MSYKEIEQRSSTDRSLAERALKWVSCVHQPLEANALLEAVQLIPEGMNFN